MKKKFISIFILSFSLMVFSGCDDLLDVDPRASLTEEQVLRDVATTQAFLNSALATMRNGAYYGNGFVIFPELLADNTKLVNAADRSGRGLGQSINASGSHINIWFLYQAINRLNMIDEAVTNNQIVITSQADNVAVLRTHAQALFLRALFYFDMVRTYSYNPNYIVNGWDYGIPYLTKGVTSKAGIEYPSRPTILSTYENIEIDLKKSIDLFTATGTPNPAGVKALPTRGAAQALLARLYLYWAGPLYPEKYQLAIDYATEAIASGVAAMSTSTANLAANWSAEFNGESLFEVAFSNTAENLGPDNCLQCWYTRNNNAAGVRTNGWGDIIASDEMVASYNAADARLTQLMRQAVRNFEPASSRETVKYNAVARTTFGLDNVPVIRIAEMFLIRAEAHYYKPGGPDEVEVRNNLNAVIDAFAPNANPVAGAGARTGAPKITTAITGTALEDAIFNERRRELAFEGHRLFDFTRRGKDVQKPAGLIIPFTDYRVLANIPLVEIQANKNLQQNPGY